jgi:hypothetical protein
MAVARKIEMCIEAVENDLQLFFLKRYNGHQYVFKMEYVFLIETTFLPTHTPTALSMIK